VEELEPRLALSAWYVAPSGSDTNPGTILQPFASLAHASAVADPGDTVFARGGLYLPTSMQYLTGSGTASAPITFTAYPSETPVIDGSHTPAQPYQHLITITGQYINFERFTLQNAHGAGIQSWGGSHLQILNNTIHDCQDTGITLGTNDSLTNTTDILVQSNMVYRNALNNSGQSWGAGIATAGASYVRFIGNTSYDNMGEGLILLLCDHCLAQGNVIHDNYSVNLYLDNATNSLVQKNFVYSTFDPTYYRDGAPAAGIQVANEAYGLINLDQNDTIINNIVKDGSANFFYGNYGRGGGMVNFLVANNVFYQADGFTGLYIDSSVNPISNSAVFANNIFYQTNGTPLTHFHGTLSGVTNDFSGAPRAGADIGAYALAANPAAVSAEQNFVTHVYQELLGRAPDSAGLTNWTNLLTQGTSRIQIVAAIEAGREFRSMEVQNLYSRLLNRVADTAGLSACVNFLGQGHSITQVEDLLLGSNEYFARRGGGTTAGFLQAVYRDVLGRAIDSGGAQDWGQNLANGLSRADVAAAILSSREAAADLVAALYQHYLNRPADPAGLNAFTTALQGRTPLEAVIGRLVGSDEFYQLANG